jgi:HAD superfamily hydrolase (TIGR01509 family)
MSAAAWRPRAVVFDLDGLIFNTEHLYQAVGTELLGRRGCRFENDLMLAIMGRPAPVSLQTMIDWHGLSDTVERLAIETEEIFAGILDEQLAFMPGVPELLDALEARGVPKAIATSSGPRFVDNVLSRFTLQPRFEFVLTCDDVVEGKPHPEIYLTAASRFGIQPHQMAVLEDSRHGARAGVAAGAVVIAVPSLPTLPEDIPGTRLIVESLADPRVYELLGLKHFTDVR